MRQESPADSTRLQRPKQRAWAVRVKPPKERPAARSFGHPDDTSLALPIADVIVYCAEFSDAERR